MTSIAETHNKRDAPRVRTLKGARILLPNNVSTFECKVRNLSDTGACIELSSTVGVPARFRLLMDDGSDELLCEVAWRTETRLGVRFQS